MRFINPSALEDIKHNRPLHLDLGCGALAREGFYGVDILEMDGVDIVADLDEPLEGLPDNSVIEVYSRHAFEHIGNFLGLMAELHRIVRPKGRIEITVPHFSNGYGYSDPTHVRSFGSYTMFYFVNRKDQPRYKVPTFYSNTRFIVKKVHVHFFHEGVIDSWGGRLAEFFTNISFKTQGFYERHLCWLWPAKEVTYILSPVKT